MSRWPVWSDARAAGSALYQRCREAAPGPEPLHLDEALRQRLGLAIYAVADQHQLPVTAVSAAQLRYRLHDRTDSLLWLYEQLCRAGHGVALPAGLGPTADAHAGHPLLSAPPSTRSRTSDDPVVAIWHRETALEGSGTLTCPWWQARYELLALLDAVLIHDHGGWPVGTRVRTRGLPPHIAADGACGPGARVSPDRAVVEAPVWELDHALGEARSQPATTSCGSGH